MTFAISDCVFVLPKDYTGAEEYYQRMQVLKDFNELGSPIEVIIPGVTWNQKYAKQWIVVRGENLHWKDIAFFCRTILSSGAYGVLRLTYIVESTKEKKTECFFMDENNRLVSLPYEKYVAQGKTKSG